MTLNDLTEFNEKHNFANGETIATAANDNFS